MSAGKDPIVAHYARRLLEFGPGPEAVQWADAGTQYARFAILGEIAPDLGDVADFGCGLGEMQAFLSARGGFDSYTGFDIVPEFIEHATARFDGIGNARAILSDAGGDPRVPGSFDYVFASGVFNNARDGNWDFMTASLAEMWSAARKGIAFNAMTSFVDYRDDGLWYVDPAQVLEFCKTRLGAHVTLRHDYVLRDGGYPFEFAVYAYRNPTKPRRPMGVDG